MNQEKIMILQMLQDGKITPDEAVKLMKSLDEKEKPRLTNKSIEEIRSDIGNAFGNLFTSLKDLGSSIVVNNLTETFEVDLEENIENLTDPIIDIKCVNGYIKIRKHDLDSVKIHVYCNYPEGMSIHNKEFYKFYIERNKIVFHPIYDNIAINLDVTIPRRIYDEIDVEGTNASIILRR